MRENFSWQINQNSSSTADCYLTSTGCQYRTDTGQFPDEEAEEGKKLAVDKVQYRSKVDARLETPFK